MLPIPDYDIRFSELSDLDEMQKWFGGASSCDHFPFGFEERDDALKNWIGFSRFKASLTGMIGEEIVAVGTLFLMPYRKVAHHCSFYLIVAPAHRKKGIGTSMVRNLIHLGKTRFKLESIHVELYDPSPISSIVRKLGFEEFARQDNFVKINGQSHPRILLEHFIP